MTSHQLDFNRYVSYFAPRLAVGLLKFDTYLVGAGAFNGNCGDAKPRSHSLELT